MLVLILIIALINAFVLVLNKCFYNWIFKCVYFNIVLKNICL